jgi:hypothetical protein
MIDTKKLSELLKKNWTHFIEKQEFMKRVLMDAYHIENLQEVKDNEVKLSPQILIAITDFVPVNTLEFEIIVEFSIPKETGILLGNHIYNLSLNGCLVHKESSGCLFLTPDNSSNNI